MARREVFERRVTLPVSASTAFAWHERPGAIDRLIPPWEKVSVLDRGQGIRNGSRVILVNQIGPLRLKWVAEHCDYRRNEQFRDVQLSGPFRHWDHTHRFLDRGDQQCILEDHIEYVMRGGLAGRWFGGGLVRTKIDSMFRYRHATTYADLELQAQHQQNGKWQIAVTGSHGLVGGAIVPLLTTAGHSVIRIVRDQPSQTSHPPRPESSAAKSSGAKSSSAESNKTASSDSGASGAELSDTASGNQRSQATNSVTSIAWDPTSSRVDLRALEGIDAVIHLAGENIATHRWSAKQKAKIRDSRVHGTRLLAEALARLDARPRVLVIASAIGFYGDRGDELLDESSRPGSDFLADVAQEWEAAAEPARAAGIRVVFIRFGVLLSGRGGALAKMLTPFLAGAGGRLGNGRQYMSWLDLDDAAGVLYHALMTQELEGPVNAVAPEPVTNAEFTRTLGRVLHRPTICPVPALAARTAFGEMADAILLSSTRVQPAQLQKSHYRFRHRKLESCLRHQLGYFESP